MAGSSLSRIAAAAATVAALLACLLPAAAGADATPDPTFSGDGVVALDLVPDTNEYIEDVAVDSQGRIVVAGTAFPEAGGNFGFAARLTADGLPDESFSDDGFASLAGSMSVANGVAIDGQDRISLSGYSYGGPTSFDFQAGRLLPTGLPDPSFSGDGFVTINVAGGSWDEAIIPCDRFTLEGSKMKAVRSTVRKVDKLCNFRMIRESEAPKELCDRLNEIRERWRDGADERGFTMDLGTDVEGENPDFLLAIADGPDGKPLAFLRLVPVFGDDPGWSLDLMQRDPDAPNGITEYLIANSALTLGRQGFRRLSMNFAAWGRLFDDDRRLSFGQKMLKRLATWLNPFFQIKSLRDFNAKFDPDWWPRSIVLEDAESAPKVALLYATTEGFLSIPVIGKKLVPPLRAESDR